MGSPPKFTKAPNKLNSYPIKYPTSSHHLSKMAFNKHSIPILSLKETLIIINYYCCKLFITLGIKRNQDINFRPIENLSTHKHLLFKDYHFDLCFGKFKQSHNYFLHRNAFNLRGGGGGGGGG